MSGHKSGINSISYSPSGEYLASGSYFFIKIWNPENGQLLRTLAAHSDRIESISFSPNSKFIASDSDDSTVKIWNTCF